MIENNKINTKNTKIIYNYSSKSKNNKYCKSEFLVNENKKMSYFESILRLIFILHFGIFGIFEIVILKSLFNL
jgi:hypothetical protein